MTRCSLRLPALLCGFLLAAPPAWAEEEAEEVAGTADADGDGYSASVDCDDNNPESTVRATDADCDGLRDEQEEEHGTSPNVADTDGDGLGDGREVLHLETDPLDGDSDNDGVNDGQEVLELHTDPLDEDDYGAADATDVTATTDDPITARLKEEVRRYYIGIGTQASGEELQSGLDATRFMLLDGVSIQRIAAAVDKAISLHNPGRRVGFEVAVPLRVLPAAQTQQRGSPSRDTGLSGDGASSSYDAAADGSRSKRRQAIEARRNRIRLFRQWQKRSLEKRILISVGIPSLAIPYTMGFFIASVMSMSGVVPGTWAWATAIPIVGTLLLGIWTEDQFAGFALLTASQLGGLAVLIVGLALKAGRPYDKDPTALRIGKRRNGHPGLTVRARPMGLGGVLQGRF